MKKPALGPVFLRLLVLAVNLGVNTRNVFIGDMQRVLQNL